MVSFHSESLDRLFEAILTLEDKEQCYAFFEDLCTIKELQDLSQRMDVAYLLDKGMNYQQISKEVNVGTATISRVNKLPTEAEATSVPLSVFTPRGQRRIKE